MSDDRVYLAHIIEMIGNIDELSARGHEHPEIDWTAISGFRNRLVHGYLEVNRDIVWNVMVNDLPELKHAAVSMLQALDSAEPPASGE